MTVAALEPLSLTGGMTSIAYAYLHYDKPIKHIRAHKPVEGHCPVDS